MFSVLVTELSCDRKSGNRLHKRLKIWYRELLALHRIPACVYMLGTTAKLSNYAVSSSRVVVTLSESVKEIFLGLGLLNCN